MKMVQIYLVVQAAECIVEGGVKITQMQTFVQPARLDGEATECLRTGGYTSQVTHDGTGTINCGQSEVQQRVTNTPHSQVRHRNEATCTPTAGK